MQATQNATPTTGSTRTTTPTPSPSAPATPTPSATQTATLTPTPTPEPVFTPGGKLSPLPLTVSFPNVGTDRSATHTLKIINSGKTMLSGFIDASGLIGTPFSVGSAAGSSFSLAHNRSQSVAITFAPASPQSTSKQAFAGTLRILTSDAKFSKVTLSVEGFGLTGKLVIPKALSFGKVKEGVEKTLTLTIKNQGLGVLHVTCRQPVAVRVQPAAIRTHGVHA